MMDVILDRVFTQSNVDKLLGAQKGECVIVKLSSLESKLPIVWTQDRYDMFRSLCKERAKSMGFKLEQIYATLENYKLHVMFKF